MSKLVNIGIETYIPKELMDVVPDGENFFYKAMTKIVYDYNKMVDDYVPYRTGNLHHSKKIEGRLNGTECDMRITWDASESRKSGLKWYADYADYPFTKNGYPKNYNHSVHSKARGWWIEASKRDFEPYILATVQDVAFNGDKYL